MNRDRDFIVGWVFTNPPATQTDQQEYYIRSFVESVPRENQLQFTEDKAQAHKFTFSEAQREAARLNSNAAVRIFIHTFSKINQ